MSIHTAIISWHRQPNEAFTDAKYNRAHTWRFDGGLEVAASSSPSVVPLPYSEPNNVDPEEAYVASLSSCHMLFFLHFAAQSGLIIESYIDNASGVMGKNTHGKTAITDVILKPQITWHHASQIDEQIISELHHQAHNSCFIANSVNTRIRVE
ncbi:OsmC family protein [Pseudoalteromonas luteoviolacea]|uniref:Peroxiredoxin n=1 Tax=Pseudoalteromonas luteoviolacea H33 TaxID=1365251 RepID=A0A166ZMR6_9GAMM|nr:OsmC family protein [Pseudoalteromonas luteoviolacea]KZN44474.1 hypothetical protein N476_05620 [Pseudoalteromonas luteoviolacea H33]KZN78491.1 hypothetical protein N477_08810 [Pseudoalteromonas luteoviolacea H33-S]MBQ4878033.1 OsmC family protein [Pseudoalteromonas luteoviolacea]MBQ4907113.1 OsmC family protein [Pseudoalteromonas luteoviolacea]